MIICVSDGGIKEYVLDLRHNGDELLDEKLSVFFFWGGDTIFNVQHTFFSVRILSSDPRPVLNVHFINLVQVYRTSFGLLSSNLLYFFPSVISSITPVWKWIKIEYILFYF